MKIKKPYEEERIPRVAAVTRLAGWRLRHPVPLRLGPALFPEWDGAGLWKGTKIVKPYIHTSHASLSTHACLFPKSYSGNPEHDTPGGSLGFS